jgi:hypothetical protein
MKSFESQMKTTKVSGVSVSGVRNPKSEIPNVWVIGDWNLDIICDLLFGAWNFLNSSTQLYLHIPKDFFNVFLGHDTSPRP